MKTLSLSLQHKSGFTKGRIAKSVAIIIMFTGLLSSSILYAAGNSNAITSFTSQGQILRFAPPLHVEGNLIKNTYGDTVYLQGVNKVEFADDPDGIWMGNTFWSDANVAQELDTMKTWGANTVRCIMALDNWKYNLSSPHAALSNREAVKKFLEFAEERGLYVIFTAYRVTNYWNGGGQDPLPYPPYQTSTGASSVISNQQDFVDWWGSVASELKTYPNVIFELWNEPTGDTVAQQSWFSVAQQCISAIRAAGATQLVIFQWNAASWVNLNYPPPQFAASTLDWVYEANLSDPLGNIVYNTHLYRTYGHIHRSPQYEQVWNYSDVDLGMQLMGYYAVSSTYPLIVDEVGCNNYATDPQNEVAFFDNALTLLEEHGISYCGFWWREINIFPLHHGPPDFVPTPAGQVLREHLRPADE